MTSFADGRAGGREGAKFCHFFADVICEHPLKLLEFSSKRNAKEFASPNQDQGFEQQ